MTVDHIILAVAAAFFLGALVYTLRSGKRISVQTVASPLVVKHPLHTAIDTIEQEGKQLAVQQLAQSIAANYAAQHQATLQAAVGPKQPAATAAPAQS